jgi:hypothetical protein
MKEEPSNMRWFEKKVTTVGSVLFRGTIQPRAAEFEPLLTSAGVAARPQPAGDDVAWRLRLERAGWAEADLFCLKTYLPVPPALVAFDPRLSDAERQATLAARSAVQVSMAGARDDVLRDHKEFLRALRIVMGADGVMAIDHRSNKFWTREALDDELAHDAPVDVEALFTLHAVYGADDAPDTAPPAGGSAERQVYWLHSHGLAELGAFDFDILQPSADFVSGSSDPTRALAYAILDGEVTPNGGPFELSAPGGVVEAVPAATFQRTADERYATLREAEDHTESRVVLCYPKSRGWLARLVGRSDRPRPARWMTQPLGDGRVVHFTHAGTHMMEERARATYGVFRSLMTELADLSLPALVKLGYVVDGGGADAREHLWFEVHEAGPDAIDATLMNQPFNIARMSAGQRGRHAVDLLTEWQIMTPVGSITPRSMRAARVIRENREKFAQALAAMRAGTGA